MDGRSISREQALAIADKELRPSAREQALEAEIERLREDNATLQCVEFDLKAEVERLKSDDILLRSCLMEAQEAASFPIDEGMTLGHAAGFLIRDALENAAGPDWIIRAHWIILREGDFDLCVTRRDGQQVAEVVRILRERAEEAEAEVERLRESDPIRTAQREQVEWVKHNTESSPRDRWFGIRRDP